MLTFLYAVLLPLAQAEEEGGGERGYEIAWAVIILSAVLGMIVALRPAKRETEVKKPKPE